MVVNSVHENASSSSRFATWLGSVLPQHKDTVRPRVAYEKLHFTTNLRYREQGHWKHKPERMFSSLLTATNRRLKLQSRVAVKGKTCFDCGQCTSVDTIVHVDPGEANLVLSLVESEIIEDLLVPYGVGGASIEYNVDQWSIVLTNRGRIMVLDRSRDVLTRYIFQLPVENFKFKRLFWNKGNDEFYTVGRTRHTPSSRVRASNRCADNSFALAVFRLEPLTFLGMMHITQEMFGPVTDISLINGVLITVSSSRVLAYNFETLLKEYSVKIFAPEEGGDGSRELPITIDIPITLSPTPLYSIEGNVFNVQFAAVPLHFLACSRRETSSFVFRSVKNLGVQPLLPFKLLADGEGHPRIQLDFLSMDFFEQDANDFMRFEGDCLACYQLQSIIGSERCEAVLKWRTAIVPEVETDDSECEWAVYVRPALPGIAPKRVLPKRESKSRAEQLISSGERLTYCVIVRHFAIDDFTIYLLVNYSIPTPNSEEAAKYLCMLLGIDRRTGLIVLITPIHDSAGKPASFTWPFHEFAWWNGKLITYAYQAPKSSIFVYEVVEPIQRVITTELPRKRNLSFKPSTDSRKQKRQKRKAAQEMNRRTTRRDDGPGSSRDS